MAGEGETPGASGRSQDRVEVRLIDRHPAPLQHGHAPGVIISAHHLVAHFGQAPAGHQTYISATNYRNSHASTPRAVPRWFAIVGRLFSLKSSAGERKKTGQIGRASCRERGSM